MSCRSRGTPTVVSARAVDSAGLNFGDCFSYALSRGSGEPLLYKGDDFTHTDVEPASEP